MALNRKERQEIIEDLTTNDDGWKEDGDDEVLNELSDEKLTVLHKVSTNSRRAIDVANVAVKGFRNDDDGTAYRINPENGQWE